MYLVTDVTTSKPANHDNINQTGPFITGPNNYVITVDMRTSWDWKTNISEVALNKSLALKTANYVPDVQMGALFHGPADDTQVYLDGGVTPDINTSFTGWQSPTAKQYNLWGFDTESHGWTQYDVVLDAPERSSWGASAEAPELGLAFYLNGMVTNMSSDTDKGDNTPPTNLEGMIVLDLQNHTAKNTSTDIITEDGGPRIGGSMVYIPRIGDMGVLISFGGATGTKDSLQTGFLKKHLKIRRRLSVG
ncbi:uncharacterized protein BCR38DRAFT_421626 [Pseudomassariella vexata]|uniref:Uncharacterized protein n=1 Tax=Pseudomassariella vexata TaxID=1141098 RepID=A0A1Y2EFB6_9PEZI|nr:uncharacterized protein BCR38DRAFT_421626 [Pseudomassariella vexata]ORY70271.1 hypothetical protein BCR38DRAFT_421626 [Pseudomassariella vexata]